MNSRAALLAVSFSFGLAVPVSKFVDRALPPPPPGVIVGTVVFAGTDAGLPYSVVSIDALNIERFTDANGRFILPEVPAGRVVVRAKHIGYTPTDLQVTVGPGDTVRIRIELTKVSVLLPPVTSVGTCSKPGAPQRDLSPALWLLFEQVKQNAERSRLLTRSYPFQYVMRRVQTRKSYRNPSQPIDTQFVDTLHLESTHTWRYKPGNMIVPERDRGVMTDALMIPALGDFADDAFIENHCFGYGGLETVDGVPMVRVDFAPAEKIRQPDISGIVYLDTATFQIRRSEITLTKPSSALLQTMSGVTIQSHYTEVAPGIPILSSYSSVMGIAGDLHRLGWGTSMTTEDLIGEVEWLRGKP